MTNTLIRKKRLRRRISAFLQRQSKPEKFLTKILKQNRYEVVSAENDELLVSITQIKISLNGFAK